MIDLMTFATKEDMQSPITKPTALLRKRIEPITQHRIVLSHCPVAHRHATAAEDPTPPPLAHLVTGHKLGDRLPLRGGPIAGKTVPRGALKKPQSLVRLIEFQQVLGWPHPIMGIPPLPIS